MWHCATEAGKGISNDSHNPYTLEDCWPASGTMTASPLSHPTNHPINYFWVGTHTTTLIRAQRSTTSHGLVLVSQKFSYITQILLTAPHSEETVGAQGWARFPQGMAEGETGSWRSQTRVQADLELAWLQLLTSRGGRDWAKKFRVPFHFKTIMMRLGW